MNKKNNRRIFSFILCVVIIICMMPTTSFAAKSMTVKMGDGSILTISANKDINNIALPTDRKYGGVDVDFVITSDKTPIKSIEIGGFTWPLSGNKVEYSHHFTSTNADDSKMVIMLEDGSSCSLGLKVKPAQLNAKNITLKTDPTGMIISGFNFPDWYGSRLYIDVYKDSAMKKRISSLNGPMSARTLAIHKKNYSWYKPNTTYYLKIYGVERYKQSNGEYYYAPAKAITKKVYTSPSVNPVVKSMKISNIKVKNLSTIFEKKYKTTYKMTFTLSKKASNIKGIKVFAAGHYYTAKGNGKTFTINVCNITDMSYKGKKTNYRLCTYSASDSVGGAYSSWTKSKTYTVK